MATADSVKTKLQGLISKANETTGAGNTNLTAAVDTLIAGFGQGGASGIYMAQVTPAEEMSILQVVHNLGTSDILLAACFAETLGDITPAIGGALAKFWAKTDISNNRSGYGYCTHANWNIGTSVANGGSPSSVTYWDYVEDENTFAFRNAGSSAAKFMAGVTYTVIIVAANAEV